MVSQEKEKDQGQQEQQAASSQEDHPQQHRQEAFEEAASRPVMLSELNQELIISFMDFTEQRQIKTCPGDIYKIINALMDYSNMLEISIREWNLTAYHQAVYEIHAQQLREIANKYSEAIGYNYYEAIETCKKKMERRKAKGSSGDDVGEDALNLAITRSRNGKKKSTVKDEIESKGKEKGRDRGGKNKDTSEQNWGLEDIENMAGWADDDTEEQGAMEQGAMEQGESDDNTDK